MAFAGAYVAAGMAGRNNAILSRLEKIYEAKRKEMIRDLKKDIVWWYKQKQSAIEFQRIDSGYNGDFIFDAERDMNNCVNLLIKYVKEKQIEDNKKREEYRRSLLPWYKRIFS